MNSKLIWGALMTAAGFLAIALCYLGARNPREPKWASDNIMGSIILPIALGLGVMGPMLLVDSILNSASSLGILDFIVALGILAAGGAILYMLRIQSRAASYDAIRNSPENVALKSPSRIDESESPVNALNRAS
jgi:hypothetical protein